MPEIGRQHGHPGGPIRAGPVCLRQDPHRESVPEIMQVRPTLGCASPTALGSWFNVILNVEYASGLPVLETKNATEPGDSRSRSAA